jgi:hypothetical protein
VSFSVKKEFFWGTKSPINNKQDTTEKPCESRFFGFVTRKRKGRRQKLKIGSEKSAVPGGFFIPEFNRLRLSNVPI